MVEIEALYRAVVFYLLITVYAFFTALISLIVYGITDVILDTYVLDEVAAAATFYWWFIMAIVTVRVLSKYEKISKEIFD